MRTEYGEIAVGRLVIEVIGLDASSEDFTQLAYGHRSFIDNDLRLGTNC